MIAYPELLVGPAEEAGIKVPPDVENYNDSQFPHWHMFCLIQLGSPMPHWTAHWENAKVISKIPEADLKKITFDDLESMGIQLGHPMP